MMELYYAEDDPDIAESVKEYLERRGIRVSIYDRVAKLREALENQLPAIVLLDWNMPDGRGDRLCGWIREFSDRKRRCVCGRKPLSGCQLIFWKIQRKIRWRRIRFFAFRCCSWRGC